MALIKNSKYSFAWYINQFEKAKKRARKLVSKTNSELFFEKPAADEWSAEECLNHLLQFGNIYYKKMNRTVEDSNPDAGEMAESFKPRLFWRGVMHVFEPPYKLKLKTISIFEPSEIDPDQNKDVKSEFLELQDRFIDQIERCRQKGVRLNRLKIGNPALPFLKMTLSECYGVILAHQRRHLWQAEQTLQKLQD